MADSQLFGEPNETTTSSSKTPFFTFGNGVEYFKEELCSDPQHKIITDLILEERVKPGRAIALTCVLEETIELCGIAGTEYVNQVFYSDNTPTNIISYNIKGKPDRVIWLGDDFNAATKTKEEIRAIQDPDEKKMAEKHAKEQKITKDIIKALYLQKYLSDLPGPGNRYIRKVYEFGYLINSRNNFKSVYAILERLTGSPVVHQMHGDLYDVMKERKRFSRNGEGKPMDLRRHFREILMGVHHMNEHGFVHLDMRLENIGFTVVDGKLEARIFNFGFASYLKGFDEMADKKKDNIFGIGKVVFPKIEYRSTPRSYKEISRSPEQGESRPAIYEFKFFKNDLYRAPELLINTIYINSDVFSVGQMIFFAYFYNEDEDGQIYVQEGSTTREIRLNSKRHHIDEAGVEDKETLIKLIKKMIKTDPKLRINSAVALSDLWFQRPDSAIFPHTPPTQPVLNCLPISPPQQSKPPKSTETKGKTLYQHMRRVLGLKVGGTLKKRKYTRRTKRNKRKTRSSK